MSGFLYAFLSSIFIAIGGITAKEVLKREHAMEFTFVSGIISFVCLLPFVQFVDFSVPKEILLILYISTFFAGLALYFHFRALRHLEISVVAPLMNLAIILIVVLAYYFLGELLTPVELIGIGLILAGAYFLEIRGVGEDGQSTTNLLKPFLELRGSRYMHILFAGIICLSISAVMSRYVLIRVPVFTAIFFSYLFLVINNFLLFAFLKKETLREALEHMRSSLGWTITSVATRLISSFLFATAVSLLYVGIAEAIQRISVFIQVLFGGRIFKERDLLWKFFASLIMLVGAVLAAL